MDECPICLEPIKHNAIVGVVDRCSHHYHQLCILQWSSHSNSCPTCRKHFHKVNIVHEASKNHIIKSFSVQDKIISTDAINNIPSEFIIPPHQVPRADPEISTYENDSFSGHGVCQICSSASYTLRTRPMISCVACDASFHVSCLGTASHAPGEQAWFCPVCDCFQELHTPQPRSSRTTPRAAPTRRTGLIATDSDVVDDPFYQAFDDLPVMPSRSAVMNGGVLLRREAQALRNLTPDEANLWSMFEQARAGDNDTQAGSSAPEVPENQTRKRRRRRTGRESSPATGTSHSGLNANETTSAAVNSRNPTSSRIATLMNQIRLSPSRRDIPSTSATTTSVRSSHLTRTRESPLLSPVTSDSETESKRPCLDHNPELTLEQKRKVQKHVRDNLRPLYKPQRLREPQSPEKLPSNNQSLSDGLITTEHDYININKSISRRIYSAIVALSKNDGSLALEDYFTEHSSKLRDLVDSCVQDELSKC